MAMGFDAAYVMSHPWPLWAVLAAPIVVYVAALLLITPLTVLITLSLPEYLTFEPSTDEELSPWLKDFIGNLALQMAAEGFEALANLKMGGSPAGTTSFVLLFVNRTTGEMGSAA